MLVVNLLAKNLPLNQNLQMFSFFMRQTWKTQLVSFNAFLRVYPSLIKKDCVINMHSLAVYVKEWLPLPRDCPLQNSDGSYVFDWLYQCQCFISFSLSITIFFSFLSFFRVFNFCNTWARLQGHSHFLYKHTSLWRLSWFTRWTLF